jgi:hypothetical protein
MADKRVAEQEKQLQSACSAQQENLKTSLKESCSRELDDLEEELGVRHENALSETAEDLTEQ